MCFWVANYLLFSLLDPVRADAGDDAMGKILCTGSEALVSFARLFFLNFLTILVTFVCLFRVHTHTC